MNLSKETIAEWFCDIFFHGPISNKINKESLDRAKELKTIFQNEHSLSEEQQKELLSIWNRCW